MPMLLNCLKKKYRQYEVKDSSRNQFLNFRLCDTCGFQKDFALDAQEFNFILSGHLPDCYQVNYDCIGFVFFFINAMFPL